MIGVVGIVLRAVGPTASPFAIELAADEAPARGALAILCEPYRNET
jgi:hypothetical protein